MLYVLAGILLSAVASALAWFYLSFIHQRAQEIKPGVWVVSGGGGNSLIVSGGKDVLLVDTKFPPGSWMLAAWLKKTIKQQPTLIVNTHGHYDHTFGNYLYPGAPIYAQSNTLSLMHRYYRQWCLQHPDALPVRLIDNKATIQVGSRQLELSCPGSSNHTRGDLIVQISTEGIVATGDLFFNGYYPYLDTDASSGASIPNMVATLRQLARACTTALFVPGHGKLAHAGDVLHYADYLEFLHKSVSLAIAAGLTEDQAVKAIDLSKWRLKILPVAFSGPKMTWATAASNIRWAYRLAIQ